MNILKKIYCRTFQTCFKLAIPILPYRDPKILNAIEELPAEFHKRKITKVMLVTDAQLRLLTQNLEKLLPDNGIECIVYDKTRPNPTVSNVEEALELYDKALSRMEQIPGSEPEIAITCLNICDTLMARDARIENEAGEPTTEDDPEAMLVVPAETDRLIDGYLDRAWKLLQTDTVPRDGYFAFVCEKCAPSFAYYGQEKRAQELKERSEEIYRKNQEN